MIPDILWRSALLTASVLIIIGMSASFAWVLTIEGVPQLMANWISSLDLSVWGFLIVLNVFLLLFGIFIEPLPGVMVLVPILAPVAAKLGIDPHPLCHDRDLQPDPGHDHAARGGPAFRHVQRIPGAHVRSDP